MTSTEIRTLFLDFFQTKQHHIVSSAPMVLKNDPTLMFTNAGMNQFKDIFLDNKTAQQKRIANSQKCLRVSGKHNDLEEVGHDTYHHTMFEMLGNWSFGDYFKQEAILWAFELLTKHFDISTDIMYATYFEGDAAEQLNPDTEAKELWKQCLPEGRILPGSKKDNFWEMGDTGPCGPCSEIHVDLRPEHEKQAIPGHTLINKDHPQVIEIWNLVFIQFNRDAKGILHPLKQKHVDTGMGFERLCRVIQKKNSNYDTDIFTPILKKLEQISGYKYGKSEQTDIAFRVIADHLRAVSFSIADGQIPSNVRAGYVIRRILRRAVRYGYTFLKLDEPFLYACVPVLAETMGAAFPELNQQQQLIEKVIFEEEHSFLRTLETGIVKFEDYILKNHKNTVIDGRFMFELYDTYGFPPDLTTLMAKEKGFSVDEKTFEQCLNEQKERSRKASLVDTEDWCILREEQTTQFVGYDSLSVPVRITKYRKISKKGQTYYQLVFDKTPFYAESGGQVGDTGVITSDIETIQIVDTRKEVDMIVHIAEQLPKEINVEFIARPDAAKRQQTKGNHTATHLLHNALRSVLGTHVEQKGSLVSADYLRFDFSHFHKMTEHELDTIERLVNGAIRANIPLNEKRNVPYQEALEQGAIALFGEKYEDMVRVVRFGDSVELCGGTHVGATGEIGFFKILGESAIAAGIRRIEAVTGVVAQEMILAQAKTIQQLKIGLNNPPNIPEAVEQLRQEVKKLEKRFADFESERVRMLAQDIMKRAKQEQGVLIIQEQVQLESESFRNLGFELKKLAQLPYFIVLGNAFSEKAFITVMVSDELINQGLHAGKMVKELSGIIGGGGGGQANMATAGGNVPEQLSNALSEAIELFRRAAQSRS